MKMLCTDLNDPTKYVIRERTHKPPEFVCYTTLDDVDTLDVVDDVEAEGGKKTVFNQAKADAKVLAKAAADTTQATKDIKLKDAGTRLKALNLGALDPVIADIITHIVG